MTELEGFRIERTLGRGTHGSVVLARQEAAGERLVALKRGTDPTLARELLAEAAPLPAWTISTSWPSTSSFPTATTATPS